MQCRLLWTIFVWVLLVNLSMGLARSRVMKIEPDVYCSGAAITETTGSHESCAVLCQSTAQCVAFSLRAGSRCLLHAHIYTSQGLMAEQGSYHTRKIFFQITIALLELSTEHKATIHQLPPKMSYFRS